MSEPPQLLALMQKTREMKAYDCVKEFESLARKLEKENIALREAKDAYFKYNKILVMLITEEQKKKALEILMSRQKEAQP